MSGCGFKKDVGIVLILFKKCILKCLKVSRNFVFFNQIYISKASNHEIWSCCQLRKEQSLHLDLKIMESIKDIHKKRQATETGQIHVGFSGTGFV